VVKKLVNLLIAKSILDTVLVGAIAVVVYTRSFPPTFHGWGEAVAESQSISGWVVDHAEPWRRVEVQLFVDGKFVGTQVAQLSRPDVVAAGWGKDEWHGYNFRVGGQPSGPHEARVYALHQSGERYTLQMMGDVIKFRVNDDGTWQQISRAKAQRRKESRQERSPFFAFSFAPLGLCARNPS
jgi:hypothetical protein